MANNTISVWFDDPTVAQVLVLLTTRKKKQPAKQKTNPHRVVRVQVAVPANSAKAVSQENPWIAVYALNSVLSDAHAVFIAWGLNAQGNIVATQGILPS
jgi:hypothetical protein